MRKILCLLLALCLLLPLCACKNEKAPADTASPAALDAASEEVFTRVSALHPLPAATRVTGLSCRDHRLLIGGAFDGGWIAGLSEISLAEDGTVQLSELYPLLADEPEAADERCLYAVCAGQDGLFYVLTGEEPGESRDPDSAELLQNPDYEGRYSLLCYDAQGALSERIRLSGWPWPMIRRVLADGEGRIFLVGQRAIAQIGRDGAVLWQRELDGDSFIDSAQLCREGVLLEVYDNRSSGASFLLADGGGELRELPPPDPAQIPNFFLNCLDPQGLDGEALLVNDRGVYRYDPDTGGGELLLDLSGAAHLPSGDLCRVEEQLWLYIGEPGELYALRLASVPQGQRQTVRVAAVNTQNTDLIDRFFNESEDYRCEIETLSPEALLTALGAGDCPDLVLIGSGMNTASPLFEDLYSYIDADPVLSREDFLPNFLPALESDGELHELWLRTLVYTLFIRTSDLNGGAAPRSCADYDALLAANPARTMFFEPFMDRNNLFSWIAVMATGEFVDRQTGTCRFDSPDFVELLEWCGAQHGDYGEGDTYTGPIYNTDYTLDDVMLLFEEMQSVERLPVIRQYYGPMTPAGFPGSDSGGSYYGRPGFGGFALAIPKNGACKEGAWACIRSLLLPEAQLSIAKDWRSGTGLPVNRQALERLAGEVPLDKEDLALLDELLAGTRKASNEADSALLDIIRDAGNAYLSGDRSAEEAARLIQSRASIYIAEQYG